MRAEVTVRCIGDGVRCCSATVDPERGGAWCRRHRPVDLTGGVAPWEGLGAEPRATGHPARRPVSEQDVETWRALAADGLTHAEIGRRFGRHPGVVQDALRAAGRERRCGADYARWAASYLAGATSSEIAKAEGLTSPLLVRRHLRRMGVPLRQRGRRVGMS